MSLPGYEHHYAQQSGPGIATGSTHLNSDRRFTAFTTSASPAVWPMDIHRLSTPAAVVTPMLSPPTPPTPRKTVETKYDEEMQRMYIGMTNDGTRRPMWATFTVVAPGRFCPARPQIVLYGSAKGSTRVSFSLLDMETAIDELKNLLETWEMNAHLQRAVTLKIYDIWEKKFGEPSGATRLRIQTKFPIYLGPPKLPGSSTPTTPATIPPASQQSEKRSRMIKTQYDESTRRLLVGLTNDGTERQIWVGYHLHTGKKTRGNIASKYIMSTSWDAPRHGTKLSVTMLDMETRISELERIKTPKASRPDEIALDVYDVWAMKFGWLDVGNEEGSRRGRWHGKWIEFVDQKPKIEGDTEEPLNGDDTAKSTNGKASPSGFWSTVMQ